MSIPHSRTRCPRYSLGLALVVLMVPIIASANIGPPSSGGRIVAEPTGVIGVEVTHETLTIDLRPLAKNGLAQVVVVYQLHTEL